MFIKEVVILCPPQDFHGLDEESPLLYQLEQMKKTNPNIQSIMNDIKLKLDFETLSIRGIQDILQDVKMLHSISDQSDTSSSLADEILPPEEEEEEVKDEFIFPPTIICDVNTKASSVDDNDDEITMPVDVVDTKKESEENNMHIVIHELISSLGQLNEPNHELLDELWEQLPIVSGVHYPTRLECSDSHERQARLLIFLTRLYEAVSRESIQKGIDTSVIYSDNRYLSMLMNENSHFDFLFH